jgi:hypothetical protein
LAAVAAGFEPGLAATMTGLAAGLAVEEFGSNFAVAMGAARCAAGLPGFG